MIRALIFDMDNTLVDSEGLHYEAWRQTLAEHGIGSFPFKDFVGYVGTSNEKVARDYIKSGGLDIGIAELVLEKQRLYLEMIPDIRTLPGVEKTLHRFYGSYRLAVASSSHLIELERILDNLDLRNYFEHIVGGDMVSRKKPDPEIYLKTRDLLGLRSEECVAFEDSEQGMNAARNAGMFTVAIPHSLSKNHNFTGADRVVEQMDLVDEMLLETLSVIA